MSISEKRIFRSYGMITMGTFLMALGTCLIYEPMSMVTGGFSGVGIVLEKLFGIPVFAVTFLLNVPLFFMARKFHTREYLFRSLYAMITFSLALAVIPVTSVTHQDYLMVQINGILGDYIMIERAANDRGFAKRFDISKIDFDLLRREFAKVKKKNLAFMDLDELIQVRLDAMIRENPRRVDYYIRYQQIIEEYNSEQDRVNIEKTFMELMDLANSMNEEEQRYVREGFGSDEELSMYDMLFDENLSKEDIKKIKKVAVDLLDKIKTKISELDHWTDKQETKAEVDNLIGKILWEELPESYSDSAIFEYRKLIFEYVFMRYKQVA